MQGGRSIILTAATASIKAAPAFSVYCATKAAIRSFARSWTLHLQARQIRVNAVSPGPTDTLFLNHLGQTEQQKMQFLTSLVTRVPLGRLGNPDEVAKAVVSGTPSPRVLEAVELTILTGWAEAVAEALACAPECVEALLADAHAGAPWRTALGIAEPSPQLSEGIYCIVRAVRAAAPPGGVPTLNALLIAAREDRPGEQALDGLARRVLRSTLEQFCTRHGKQI